MKIMKNKKAGTPIAITLLVLMTVVLTGAGLYIFNVNSAKVSKEIIDSKVLDIVYFKANLVDFYIQESFESSNNLEDFRNRLGNYPDNLVSEELKVIKESVKESDFSNNFNKLVLKIEVKEEYMGIIIRYLYESSYEKDFAIN